ncbi:MAG: hypothetical protein WD335_02480 [Candidatus Paceibacterota bacterium]
MIEVNLNSRNNRNRKLKLSVLLLTVILGALVAINYFIADSDTEPMVQDKSVESFNFADNLDSTKIRTFLTVVDSAGASTTITREIEFSAYDPDGDDLSFRWETEDSLFQKIIPREEFNNPPRVDFKILHN